MGIQVQFLQKPGVFHPFLGAVPVVADELCAGLRGARRSAEAGEHRLGAGGGQPVDAPMELLCLLLSFLAVRLICFCCFIGVYFFVCFLV